MGCPGVGGKPQEGHGGTPSLAWDSFAHQASGSHLGGVRPQAQGSVAQQLSEPGVQSGVGACSGPPPPPSSQARPALLPQNQAPGLCLSRATRQSKSPGTSKPGSPCKTEPTAALSDDAGVCPVNGSARAYCHPRQRPLGSDPPAALASPSTAP